MQHRSPRRTLVATLCLAAAAVSFAVTGDVPPSPAADAVVTVPGMPPVPDSRDLYSEAGAGKLSAAVAGALPRIYVPNVQSNDVYVIDPATMKVVDRFKVGVNPQHVVPSWDLKTLWVANNAEGRTDGSLTPIDPVTGKPGKAVVVDDPYNMYFTPDGRSAIIVAEARKRLDFRDAHSMQMQQSLATPQCDGINHADFSIDGRYAIFTCEFQGSLVKIDLVERKVLGYLKLSKPAAKKIAFNIRTGIDPNLCTTAASMPQDIRISPDGKLFYIADMEADGVFVVDGATFRQIDFIATGIGTHGLYPSRDGKKLYVANRGSNKIHGPPHGKGSVSVVDFATRKVEATWPIPGGGSPDMGNVSADGKRLWLAGRYDNVVYAIDTATGDVTSIPVGTRTARADRVAAAGPLFARSHRQHALATAHACCRCPVRLARSRDPMLIVPPRATLPRERFRAGDSSAIWRSCLRAASAAPAFAQHARRLSGPPDPLHHPQYRRRHQRHSRPADRRAPERRAGTAGHRRKPPRCRGTDRAGPYGQGSAGRLHDFAGQQRHQRDRPGRAVRRRHRRFRRLSR